MLLEGRDPDTATAKALGLTRAGLLQLRCLLAERQTNSWRLGDALVAAYGAPPRANHHDGSSQLIEALANELGSSVAGLSAARITAAAWPLRERRPSVAFSVHRELAGRADRFALLDRFIDGTRRSQVTPSTLRLRDFLAKADPTPTRRGYVDPVERLARAALALDRESLERLIERLSEALAAPAAA